MTIYKKRGIRKENQTERNQEGDEGKELIRDLGSEKPSFLSAKDLDKMTEEVESPEKFTSTGGPKKKKKKKKKR